MKENETAEEFEARMIAQFNKRVNQHEETPSNEAQSSAAESVSQELKDAKETGGPKGLEPTRYGDWEAKGRCHDF